MNNLKRVLTTIAALTCILTSVSCSLGNSEKSKGNTPQTADQVLEKAYQAIDVDFDLEYSSIRSAFKMGDTGNIFINAYTDKGSVLAITDSEFLTVTEIDLPYEKEGNAESYFTGTALGDGTICVIESITDYGDFELPDYDDPDFDYENFDYEAMEKAATMSFNIYHIDAEGNITSTNEITGVEKYQDPEFGRLYINEIYPCGNDKVFIRISGMQEEKFIPVDMEGKLGEPADFGNVDWINSACSDDDGNFLFMCYEDANTVIKTYDTSTMSMTDNVIKINDAEMSVQSMIKGDSEYPVYVTGTTSLYGIKADGTSEEIINWVDSDLNGDYISTVLPAENGDFIVFEHNWQNNKGSIYRLTERDVSELSNTQIINMAIQYSDTHIMDEVQAFNKSNTEYRIKLEDYSKYYEWDDESNTSTNTPEKQFKQDIASGKNFDIICMSNSQSLFSNLANKGILADLYDYLGKDGTVAKEDIVEPIIKYGEINGKLVSLSPSFNIDTYAAKTKFVDKENWSIDDLIETYNNLPEGMKLLKYDNTKESVFGLFMGGISDYIDYNNGTCNFNSPEFIKILEFCNRFDNEGEGDSLNWDTATQEEMEEYWADQEVRCRDDKALLDRVYISDMRGYARAEQATFNDEITFVGYPSKDGGGASFSENTCFAITENSANKDICWKFISQFFDEDYQTGEEMYDIPALKSAFEKKLDDAMKKPYWVDPETGKKEEYDDQYFLQGSDKPVTIKPLTQEKRDYLEQYILSAEPKSAYYYDETIFPIMNEEIEAFFKGEKTAQETADILQNRISILISEQS